MKRTVKLTESKLRNMIQEAVDGAMAQRRPAKKTQPKRLTESRLRNMINEAVKKAINEVSYFTANSAYSKAQHDLYDLKNRGLGNSEQAAKRRQQLDAFDKYQTTDPDGQKNEYGRTVYDSWTDVANAHGIKATGREIAEAFNDYVNNGYDYNKMSNRRYMKLVQQINDMVPNQKVINPDGTLKSPEELGYQYVKGKKGFLGFGATKSGWKYQGNNNQQ